MTKTKLAEELGISRTTLYRLEKAHFVQAVPIGKRKTKISRHEQKRLRKAFGPGGNGILTSE